MKTTVDVDDLACAAQAGDQKAKGELFRELMPLVKWGAFRFTGPDRDDLFQAASLGFCHALRTWKPNRQPFKVWLGFWVRAYAGRLTDYHLWDRRHELPLEVPDSGGDDEPLELDASDEWAFADEVVDEIARRQAHGIIDGMASRREAIVLQERLRGLSLDEVALRRAKDLKILPTNRESVRKLELKALKRAKALVRA